jgi:hypothetical protein
MIVVTSSNIDGRRPRNQHDPTIAGILRFPHRLQMGLFLRIRGGFDERGGLPD